MKLLAVVHSARAARVVRAILPRREVSREARLMPRHNSRSATLAAMPAKSRMKRVPRSKVTPCRVYGRSSVGSDHIRAGQQACESASSLSRRGKSRLQAVRVAAPLIRLRVWNSSLPNRSGLSFGLSKAPPRRKAIAGGRDFPRVPTSAQRPRSPGADRAPARCRNLATRRNGVRWCGEVFDRYEGNVISLAEGQQRGQPRRPPVRVRNEDGRIRLC